jgi:hypothetical protein
MPVQAIGGGVAVSDREWPLATLAYGTYVARASVSGLPLCVGSGGQVGVFLVRLAVLGRGAGTSVGVVSAPAARRPTGVSCMSELVMVTVC